MSLDKNDLAEIAKIVHEIEEQQTQELKAMSRKHWPRRVILGVTVLGGGVAIHYLVEHTELKFALHSCELAIAACIDHVFARAID